MKINKFFNLKKYNFFSIFNRYKFFNYNYFMCSSFLDILKQRSFLLLGSLFTILLNICLGYKGYTLFCAVLAVISLTLDSLINAYLKCKNTKPMKEANDSETLNLRNQLLTGDEIRSFVYRLRTTPLDRNMAQELRMLKEYLSSLNLNI